MVHWGEREWLIAYFLVLPPHFLKLPSAREGLSFAPSTVARSRFWGSTSQPNTYLRGQFDSSGRVNNIYSFSFLKNSKSYYFFLEGCSS